MVRRLAVVAGGFALLVGCEAEFYGDLGEIGFATNLDRWTPSSSVARGAPMQVGVAAVGGKDEGFTIADGGVRGELDGAWRDEKILEVDGDRGRVWFTAVGPDGVTVEDHFPLRFEDPRSARVDGEPRLGVAAGRACEVQLSLHGRRGVTLGHDPEAIGVAGQEGLEVWSGGGASIEVAAGAGVEGRIAVDYGTFGAVTGPEIVGVGLDDVVRVELTATPFGEGSVLMPVGYTADDLPVSCVPVAWEIPAGIAVEAVDPLADGSVPAILVPGKGVPDGLSARVYGR